MPLTACGALGHGAMSKCTTCRMAHTWPLDYVWCQVTVPCVASLPPSPAKHDYPRPRTCPPCHLVYPRLRPAPRPAQLPFPLGYNPEPPHSPAPATPPPWPSVQTLTPCLLLVSACPCCIHVMFLRPLLLAYGPAAPSACIWSCGSFSMHMTLLPLLHAYDPAASSAGI